MVYDDNKHILHVIPALNPTLLRLGAREQRKRHPVCALSCDFFPSAPVFNYDTH